MINRIYIPPYRTGKSIGNQSAIAISIYTYISTGGLTLFPGPGTRLEPKKEVGPGNEVGPRNKVGPGNKVEPLYASVCIRIILCIHAHPPRIRVHPYAPIRLTHASKRQYSTNIPQAQNQNQNKMSKS